MYVRLIGKKRGIFSQAGGSGKYVRLIVSRAGVVETIGRGKYVWLIGALRRSTLLTEGRKAESMSERSVIEVTIGARKRKRRVCPVHRYREPREAAEGMSR